MNVVSRARDRLFGGDGIRIGDDRIEPIPLRPSTIHDLCSNRRRRLIINYLVRDADGHCTISDAAEYVAGVEALNDGGGPEHRPGGQRKAVYISLYQGHLPKLAEAGVVEWDKDRGTIDATDLATTLAQIDHTINCVASGAPA